MTDDTVLVVIENTYGCGRESAFTFRLPVPPGRGAVELESWWADVVHDLTGDGHPCGSREHALYEAKIVGAPGYRPDLLGEFHDWEG